MSFYSLALREPVDLETRQSPASGRVPSRSEVEQVLIRFAFEEELLFEAICNLPPAGQIVRRRLERTTNALMSLMDTP